MQPLHHPCHYRWHWRDDECAASHHHNHATTQTIIIRNNSIEDRMRIFAAMKGGHVPKTLLPSCQSLRVFEAAVRHLSFTRAAEEIHLTQGAVSQQIKLLEDRLQTRLFLRSGRKLSLTSAGERLYRPARALLAQLQLFVDLAQSQGDTEALIVHAPHCF